MNEPKCEAQEMSPMGKTLELLHKAIVRNQEQANVLGDRLNMLVVATPQVGEATEKCPESNCCGLDDRLKDAVHRLDSTHSILQVVLDGLQV